MKKLLAGLGALAVLSGGVSAAEPTASTGPVAVPMPPPLPYGAPVDLATARSCVKAAQAAAASNQWQMVVAVVDAGGHLVLLERMDNAQYGSVEPALQKAETAVAFRRPSKAFDETLAKGGAALRLLKLPGALPIEGGLPLAREGKIVGAVGVSGGSAQQDGVVAQACADALK